MAAAVAPLIIEGIASLAPTVLNLITSLVHKQAPVVEQRYGRKSGPVKLADVSAAVMDALNRAAAAGAIPKELPPDPVIMLIVQTVVASMNISGQLSAPAAVASGDIKTVTLAAGQSITIAVAA